VKPRKLELKLTPAQAADQQEVLRVCAKKLKKKPSKISVVPVRRAVDARRGEPKIVLNVEVWQGQPPPPPSPIMEKAPDRLKGDVIVVGAGPAGYFCALELILLGKKPIVLERGKDVQARRYDLRAIMQEHTVNPHSNYCFGEGGAGTYSDGKLYTRAVKRGDVAQVLQLLVDHGAQTDIMVDSHPHIGSDKLPHVVENLRQTIVQLGGEVHFGSHVTDLLIHDGVLEGVEVNGEDKLRGESVVLATGHSARDIFHLLHRRGITVENKPYALGLRVEHPQSLVDQIQYRQSPRDQNLPAASYRLAKEGVYSFCMCPGGIIVPAATAPGEIVVNGMSPSKRNTRWANSGIVTSVEPEDLAPFHDEQGPLAGLAFQQSVEQRAFEIKGDDSQRAPCQRLVDFLEDRISKDLPRVSYVPGVVPINLSELLPPRMADAMKHSFQQFGEMMKGYLDPDAVVVGVESRTSSPVRIPRDKTALTHPQFDNLYPCGEGAGFAGGIVSAAMDGQRVARAVAYAKV
jgi:uncharacterized FAD-dependent dehydrogenase